jgi:SWI/SNF-related matrix-associated actin-dependent regulator 1 of chromatin subfamily A
VLNAKRPPPDTIEIISDDDDDEDDLVPPRGDIRPTTFKAQIAAYAYNPDADAERRWKQKLRQIYDVYGKRFPAEKVREALRRTNEDVEEAMTWLEQNVTASSSRKTPAIVANNRRLTSKGTLEAVRSARPSTPSPPKAAPKRRLVKGLKPRTSPSPQKPTAAPPSSDDPIVINLVDNDKEDAYQAERSPSPDEDGEDRVLNCINSSTLKELAAMTGMKEALLEPILEKRPFKNLHQAKRVSFEKKPGARKSARVSLGENVVDAVEVFLNAVSAIDVVVSNCETKANMVKGSMDHWDLDTFGRDRRSARSTPDADLPPTPTSSSGTKYRRPPIAQQPSLMDGHCTMRPFQLFGLNWMSLLYNYGIGCILADEMGLGKTCQVISFISHLVESFDQKSNRHDRRPWPNLIVVPPSTYNNWLGEFERFAPDISVIGYRGSQAERAEIAYEVEHDPESYHVVLATYSQINSEEDVASMRALDLNAAIFDEGHKMKNPQTKIYRDLQRIDASWKMLLTGWFLDIIYKARLRH